MRRRAGCEPVAQAFRSRAVGVEDGPAAVPDLAGGLPQEQALGGPRQVDAAAFEGLHDGLVVDGRVAAQQRQVEPAPARRGG